MWYVPSLNSPPVMLILLEIQTFNVVSPGSLFGETFPGAPLPFDLDWGPTGPSDSRGDLLLLYPRDSP